MAFNCQHHTPWYLQHLSSSCHLALFLLDFLHRTSGHGSKQAAFKELKFALVQPCSFSAGRKLPGQWHGEDKADQWQRLQLGHKWIISCSLWVCCASNSAAWFLPTPKPSLARAAWVWGEDWTRKAAWSRMWVHAHCEWGQPARTPPFRLSCTSLKEMGVSPLLLLFLLGVQGERKGAGTLQRWLSLILVIAQYWSAQETEFFHSSTLCWQSRKGSVWREGRSVLALPLSKKDTGTKGKWKSRDLLFKGVERKGLEREEKSRSTNLSYMVPKKWWFHPCGSQLFWGCCRD